MSNNPTHKSFSEDSPPLSVYENAQYDGDHNDQSIPSTVLASKIPSYLKEFPQWVSWRYELRKNSPKPTKPPYSPITHKRAKSNDLSTCADFDTAYKALQNVNGNSYNGIGFVFSPKDGITGIDVDLKNTEKEKEFNQLKSILLGKFGSTYCEISPSGIGFHILVLGSSPLSGKKVKLFDGGVELEIYNHKSPRYFTVTGDHIPKTSTDITEQQESLNWFCNEFFAEKKPPKSPPKPPVKKSSGPPLQNSTQDLLSDDDILRILHKARNHAKFESLWSGGGNTDLSRGDSALCEILGYYTQSQVGGGKDQIDRLFRQSGRLREKWDEKRGQQTYGELTIANVVQDLTTTYTPKITQRKATGLHLTDVGNAERFSLWHGQNVRFCFTNSCWYIWDNTKWAQDDTGRIKELAIDTTRRILTEASDVNLDIDQSKKLTKHAFLSESNTKLNGMLSLAQSKCAVKFEHFDKNKMALNVKNGIVNLINGSLSHHNPNELHTKICDVLYDQHALCPTWLDFLSRIFNADNDLIDFVQRAVGWSLTGDISEQVFFVLWGTGRNGKSTFIDTLHTLIGDYARVAASELLILRKGGTQHPTELADLKGARFVSSVETESGKRLNEARIKGMTGDAKIKARFMRQDFFEFEQEYKIWLATNHKPNIKGDDLGIWRRIMLIPFEIVIPENEVDRRLLKKLKNEMPGILNWAIQGCLKWQNDGLKIPQCVTNATQEYRQEQDVIGNFINECCFLDTRERTKTKDLYTAYQNWCTENGEYTGNNREFGKRLTERGFKPTRTKSARFYEGIKLLDDDKMTSGDISLGINTEGVKSLEAYSNSDVTLSSCHPLNSLETTILNLLSNQGNSLSEQQIYVNLGVEISPTELTGILNSLCEKRLIVQIGSGYQVKRGQ